MSSSEDQPRDVVRFYTHTRRIPTLIGQISGTRLPGGPYTTLQIVGGGVVAFTLLRSAELWARFGGLVNFAIGLVAVIGVTKLLGLVPWTGRNPLQFVIAAAGLMSRAGARTSIGTRSLSLRRPHRVHSRTMLAATAPTGPVDTADVEPVEPAAAPVPQTRPEVWTLGVALSRFGARHRARPARAEAPPVPDRIENEVTPEPFIKPVAPMSNVSRLLADALSSEHR